MQIEFDCVRCASGCNLDFNFRKIAVGVRFGGVSQARRWVGGNILLPEYLPSIYEHDNGVMRKAFLQIDVQNHLEEAPRTITDMGRRKWLNVSPRRFNSGDDRK